MDSLTQSTFGAARGEAILGQRVGRKALVWGASQVATLNDLHPGPIDDETWIGGVWLGCGKESGTRCLNAEKPILKSSRPEIQKARLTILQNILFGIKYFHYGIKF